MARMETDLPWFGELSAEDRSWVGLIVQAGIRGFVDWYRDAGGEPGRRRHRLAASVFGAAPRALAGVITLQQTVDLVRLTHRGRRGEHRRARSTPRTRPTCTRAVLRYAREVAFATAEVYARAAEVARRLGRPARGAGRRRGAARRGRRGRALPRQRPRLGRPRRRRGRARRRARPQRTETDVFDEVRRVGPGRRHGRAVRRPGRPARGRPGRGGRPREAAPRWSSTSSATGPVVVGPVAARPRPGPRLRPGRPVGAPRRRRAGRRRRARCAATTCCPSAPSPATATPAASWSTRSTCRWLHARGTLIETLAAYFDARRLDRGDRPRAVRAPQHRALPAQPGRRAHRPHPHRRPRDAFTAADRPGPGPPVRASASLCRDPTKNRPASFVRRRTRARAPGPGRAGARARHRRSRPRRPDPRIPHALARGPDVRRAASTGSPPSPASTWPTTAPRPTPRPSATPRSPSRCWSPPAWSPPSSSSRTRPTPSSRSARSPATASASSTAAAGARVITAEQAMVLVRERGNAMAEAAAAPRPA